METSRLKSTDMSAAYREDIDIVALPSGGFPIRLNTVVSEVLARLLRGEQLTGMDAVFRANTTRLAAYINQLEKTWGWKIARVDVDVGTSDGRIATIRKYFLARPTIRHAFDCGALEYCRSVDVARATRRTKVDNVKVEAQRRNASRLAMRVDPYQPDMFGGLNG